MKKTYYSNNQHLIQLLTISLALLPGPADCFIFPEKNQITLPLAERIKLTCVQI